MFLIVAAILTLVILGYTLFVRRQDVPEEAPPPPYQHLEGRKAAIYENLRDLQFEYRVGKLSDDDYQRTKKELQSELAGVMAEIDRMKAAPAEKAASVAASNGRAPASPKDGVTVCPHCQASFDKPLRFCGECGKPMGVTA